MYLPYLKFSDPLPETHFLLGLIVSYGGKRQTFSQGNLVQCSIFIMLCSVHRTRGVKIESCYMCRSRGGTGGPYPPEKSQKYRFSKQYWSGSPENHRATKPAINVGPSSACHHRPVSETPFKWCFIGGLMIAHFSGICILYPLINGKKKVEHYPVWTPSDKTFWIRASVI